MSPGYPGSRKVPARNLIIYPCMSSTPGKANVQDIQYCLFHLASDTHRFPRMTPKLTLPSRGLKPVALLPVYHRQATNLASIQSITVINRSFLHLGFSQLYILCIIKYTQPPDKKAKACFLNMGVLIPHFTETLHNYFELVYLVSVL